jgi:hypothetical protein
MFPHCIYAIITLSIELVERLYNKCGNFGRGGGGGWKRSRLTTQILGLVKAVNI